jgi:DNA-directed RNA polymerase sigma subunit (sigma70/sigma32)
LTKNEEIELSRHALANDEQAESAGMTLVEANLAMVVSIAERYPRREHASFGRRSKGP